MKNVSDDDLLKRVTALSPTSFENLTLDLLRAVGFRNLVWRTPGADGGRDIEGERTVTDPSGTDYPQKWYFECKRYTSSVDWPTVWQKLAYADSHGADVLFLITNSQPSPQCENEIRSWNEMRRRPIMRVWRGYDIPKYLRLNEDVAVAHGIIQSQLTPSTLAVDFASVLSKLVQATHGAWVFSQDPEIPLISAASLSELFHQRLQCLSLHGRFVSGVPLKDADDWPWLTITGAVDLQEEVGFRAIVSAVRHVLQAPQLTCQINGPLVYVSADSSNSEFNTLSEEFLRPILLWASCDTFRITSAQKAEFSLRFNDE